MVIGTKIAQWTLSTKISQEQYYLSRKELLARLTGLLVELNRFKCHGIKSMTCFVCIIFTSWIIYENPYHRPVLNLTAPKMSAITTQQEVFVFDASSLIHLPSMKL